MQSVSRDLTTKQADEHNYGIDLLKIISMIMIVIVHILGHGGVLGASTNLFAHRITAAFLGIASCCAVNSYALISGFLNYGKRRKYSSLLILYLQVVFYTLITTAVFLLNKPEVVGIKTMLGAIVPFAYNTYWYFSAYFCLFFFIPFLNLMIDKCEKGTVQKIILTCFAIFSVLPILFNSDFAVTKNGYSFLWLAVLYTVGAYIKKYGSDFSYKNSKNLCFYALCVVITWLSGIIIEVITKMLLDKPKYGNYLVHYTSPTIVLCSVFLLLFFANVKCNKTVIQFARFFAPVSFGVYLLHDEPLIRLNLINNAFTRYASFSPILMALAVIATALCIWLIGSFVDRIRLTIFNALKIRHFCDHVESELKAIFGSLRQRFQKKHPGLLK